MAWSYLTRVQRVTGAVVFHVGRANIFYVPTAGLTDEQIAAIVAAGPVRPAKAR